MILYDFKSDLKVSGCLERLKNAFGDEAPSRSTVESWYFRFSTGDFNLADEERVGRPVTATGDENIDAVKKLVEEDPHITYEKIEETLGIASGSVQTILHEHLKLRKVCARWVPHYLTEEEKQARVVFCKDMKKTFEKGKSNLISKILTGDETWVYCYDPKRKEQSKVWIAKDEPRPVKVKRERSVGKIMVAVFFTRTGFIQVIPLVERKTVNAEWYVESCLKPVFNSLLTSTRLKKFSSFYFHHDNAPAHSAKLTSNYLEETDIKILAHPPYSPDLAPADFYLFPKVKDGMRGIKYDDPNMAFQTFKSEVEKLTLRDLEHCFEKWFERFDKCIDAGGRYFEKD
jgi:histone-lysine N-methyltransferase SETMAR